jgi:hypothetical protein
MKNFNNRNKISDAAAGGEQNPNTVDEVGLNDCDEAGDELGDEALSTAACKTSGANKKGEEVKLNGADERAGGELNDEILSAALGVIKRNNRQAAVKEVYGNCFRAIDAALDGGEIYRIIVVKSDDAKSA